MAADGPTDPEPPPSEPDPRATTDALPEVRPPETTGPPNVAFADTMAGDSERIARALADDSGALAATLGSGDFGPATMQGLKALNYGVGEVISGRYEVSGVLGQGGFAVVYEARDRVVDRQVAIKVLNTFADAVDETNTQRAVERFEREARAAAMITHPNVVTIFDLGVADRFGRPFIVMELLNGHDLSEELKTRGAMPPERALRLFTGALAGLAAGHERGIVHKDLKPANLFLTNPDTPDEKLRLFDFGIARLGAGTSGLTKTGEMFGTPQYMAPEYIGAGQVSPALDVYQMGLILVEMFTGRKVIEADVAITAAIAHGKGALPLPVELLEGPLGDVLLGALAHDPEVRFADAGVFLEALSAATDGIELDGLAPNLSGTTRLLSEAADPTTGKLRPAPVETLPPIEATPTDRRRMAVVLGGLLAVVVGGWWLAAGDRPPPPPPPIETAMVAPPGRHDAAPTADMDPADAAPIFDSAPDRTADARPPVTVRLAVTPDGARITADGEPLVDDTLRFADEDAPGSRITVSKAGYVTATREITPADAPGIELRLERAPAGRDDDPPPRVEIPPQVTIIPPPPADAAPPPPEPAPDPEPSGAVILD